MLPLPLLGYPAMLIDSEVAGVGLEPTLGHHCRKEETQFQSVLRGSILLETLGEDKLITIRQSAREFFLQRYLAEEIFEDLVAKLLLFYLHPIGFLTSKFDGLLQALYASK